MSGNTIGKLFTVTTLRRERTARRSAAIVDGCPPGLELVRGRHPARPRPPPARHVAPHHPAPRGRRGAASSPACSRAGPPARRSGC
ncbi:MAG: hypothetical protein MZW92_48260 [Comamonadaceae bacterium]|nr:hypothetical protein [Comamonadaceae bacterium]